MRNCCLLIMCLLLILIEGCSEESNSCANYYEFCTSRIHYYKDNRTNLCFAYWWGGNLHGGPALTNVPCEQVEHLLETNIVN